MTCPGLVTNSVYRSSPASAAQQLQRPLSSESIDGKGLLASPPNVSRQSMVLGCRVGSSVNVPLIATLPSTSVTVNELPTIVSLGSQPCSSQGFGSPSFSQATCLQVPWSRFSSSAMASD